MSIAPDDANFGASTSLSPGKFCRTMKHWHSSLPVHKSSCLRRPYPLIPKFLVSTKFNNLERIGSLDIPIQIIHGTADDLIPHSMGEELYSKVKQQYGFSSVEGAGHSDLLEKSDGSYASAFKDFFKKVLNR